MGKHTVWTCDVCGKQVNDNSENNFQVNLYSSGSVMGNFSKVFEGIICDSCTDKKSTQEILFAVAEEGKKATSLIKVASVTFKAIKVDNTLEGVPVKALAADSITEPIEEIKH
jgi:hypothetical protein